MLVNFAHFLASLILALIALKVLEIKVLERNPDSTVGAGLAFLLG